MPVDVGREHRGVSATVEQYIVEPGGMVTGEIYAVSGLVPVGPNPSHNPDAAGSWLEWGGVVDAHDAAFVSSVQVEQIPPLALGGLRFGVAVAAFAVYLNW